MQVKGKASVNEKKSQKGKESLGKAPSEKPVESEKVSSEKPETSHGNTSKPKPSDFKDSINLQSDGECYSLLNFALSLSLFRVASGSI